MRGLLFSSCEPLQPKTYYKAVLIFMCSLATLAIIGCICLWIACDYLNQENKELTFDRDKWEQTALDNRIEADNTARELEKARENLAECSKKIEEQETTIIAQADEITALKSEIQTLEEIIETYNQQENTVNDYGEIVLTTDERELLEWVVALESKNQPDVGQRAVIETIFNRKLLNEWQNTVWGVLTAKGQFDSLNYLDKPYAKPTEKERANIDYVLEHGRTVLPPDYVYFATYKANGKDFIQIQDHYFSRG